MPCSKNCEIALLVNVLRNISLSLFSVQIGCMMWSNRTFPLSLKVSNSFFLFCCTFWWHHWHSLMYKLVFPSLNWIIFQQEIWNKKFPNKAMPTDSDYTETEAENTESGGGWQVGGWGIQFHARRPTFRRHEMWHFWCSDLVVTTLTSDGQNTVICFFKPRAPPERRLAKAAYLSHHGFVVIHSINAI